MSLSSRRGARISLAMMLLLAAFAWDLPRAGAESVSDREEAPYLLVLGIAQDAGYPQAGTKEHPAWEDPSLRRLAVSLALVDPGSGERWLFEATPDFKHQLRRLDRVAPVEGVPGLAGILLTHAHIGHYTGLVHLGREAMGASQVPVWVMPRMERYLRENGPWELLVRLRNVELHPLRSGERVKLNERLSVTPILVPHRDEYSETVGFRIDGPRRSALFVPDIDKWELWDEMGTRVEELVASVDVAYLDGSFFADGEIPGRSMAEIPHPFIEESLRRFGELPREERSKIRFIHFNRTNPVLVPGDPSRGQVEEAGFGLAAEGERVPL